MSKKVTIYEVAKQAGVAISTVSRVLNGSPNVSEATKEKVSKAIKELKFRPQVSARKLASRSPHMLAIAVPTFTTPYFNEVLKGVKDEIKKMDLDIIIYNTGSRNPEEAVQNFFDRGTADAAILMSINVTEPVNEMIKSSGIPIVLMGTTHSEYNYINVNDYRGGFLAGEHLVKKGFERIGMITTNHPNEVALNRMRGFKDALREFKMPVYDEYFIYGDTDKHAGYTEEAGYEAIYKYAKMDAFPDAIFCSNDTQALGAIHALTQLGLKVPEDVALMGYDNIKISKYLDLTTIDQKMHEVGVITTQILRGVIDNPEGDLVQTAIDPVLVERNSSQKK